MSAVLTRSIRPDSYEQLATDQLIYTKYDNGEEMLYDLKQDPMENHNIVAQTERQAEVANMRRLLAANQEIAASAKVSKPRPRRSSEDSDPN